MRNPVKNKPPIFTTFPFSLSQISLRIWLFMFLLSMVLMLGGYQIGSRAGLWIGFFVASIFFTMIYFFADPPLISFFNARKLSGQDPWGLNSLSAKYSRLIGIAAPDIYLVSSTSISAFSLGPSFRQSCICLTTELLKRLSVEEVQAVIAHQVCHAKGLGSFNFSILSALIHSLTGFAVLLDSAWPPNWTQNGKSRFHPFLTTAAPIAGALLRFAQNDRKYFENDELSASLIGSKKAIANALWKIESYCQTRPLDIPPCTNHLFITNPEGLKESSWFFMTHPNVENRIRRLVGTYPL